MEAESERLRLQMLKKKFLKMARKHRKVRRTPRFYIGEASESMAEMTSPDEQKPMITAADPNTGTATVQGRPDSFTNFSDPLENGRKLSDQGQPHTLSAFADQPDSVTPVTLCQTAHGQYEVSLTPESIQSSLVIAPGQVGSPKPFHGQPKTSSPLHKRPDAFSDWPEPNGVNQKSEHIEKAEQNEKMRGEMLKDTVENIVAEMAMQESPKTDDDYNGDAEDNDFDTQTDSKPTLQAESTEPNQTENSSKSFSHAEFPNSEITSRKLLHNGEEDSTNFDELETALKSVYSEGDRSSETHVKEVYSLEISVGERRQMPNNGEKGCTIDEENSFIPPDMARNSNSPWSKDQVDAIPSNDQSRRTECGAVREPGSRQGMLNRQQSVSEVEKGGTPGNAHPGFENTSAEESSFGLSDLQVLWKCPFLRYVHNRGPDVGRKRGISEGEGCQPHQLHQVFTYPLLRGNNL